MHQHLVPVGRDAGTSTFFDRETTENGLVERRGARDVDGEEDQRTHDNLVRARFI